ncbi:hypothetical protein C8T65DRAFT_55431 [Cerioporus squamosus]|nr:hypothetical protein C8T65DRAFT_55431 [Cerioporus squamosus]
MPFAQTVLVEIQCPAQNGLINTLAFSDTGEFLAAANDSDLLVYRVADGSLVTSVEVGGPALSCAWRSDGPHHDILSVLGYTANRSTSRSIVRVRLQRPGDPKFHAVSCPAPLLLSRRSCHGRLRVCRFPPLAAIAQRQNCREHKHEGCQTVAQDLAHGRRGVRSRVRSAQLDAQPHGTVGPRRAVLREPRRR